MKPLSVGDLVKVVKPENNQLDGSAGDPILMYILTLSSGVYPGDIGEVVRTCTCMEEPEHFKLGMTRVQFKWGKTCLPRAVLRLIQDGDNDKMVDWSKVPKPWEIGVTH